MLEVVRLLALIPYASIPFSIETPRALAVSFAAAFALWAWWPRRLRHIVSIATACGAAVILAFVLVPPFTGDRVVMLDVGQGDSFLVQSRGESMLVDTGNQDTALLDQLARCRLAHIGAVLITHADDDHRGSLDALRKAVEVDRIVVARDMLTCDDVSARSLREEAAIAARDVVGVQKGDSFSIGAFRVRVVWPASFTEGGGNADSLCVVLEYDGDADGVTDWTALMTGDAEKDQLRAMIDEGSIGDIDLLKVGHHGSRNGSTAEEVQTLDPEIALISCGVHNRYGHPARETLDMLSDAGAVIYRSDVNGQVRCLLTSESISVECEKDAVPLAEWG